jgi:hypothetical protein
MGGMEGGHTPAFRLLVVMGAVGFPTVQAGLRVVSAVALVVEVEEWEVVAVGVAQEVEAADVEAAAGLEEVGAVVDTVHFSSRLGIYGILS